MKTFQTNLLEDNIFNLVSDFTLTAVVRVTPGPTPAPTPIICLTTDPTPILYPTPTSTPVLILTTDPTPIQCLTLDQTQTLFLCLPPTQTQILSLTMVSNPSLTATNVITIDEIYLNKFSLRIQLWNVKNTKFQNVSFNFTIFRSSWWCLIQFYNISFSFIIFHLVIRVSFFKI